MSAPLLCGLSIVFLYLGYRFYGSFLERRIVEPSDTATPAHDVNDGVDFVPCRPAMLFGHHFASIAGAGPIIGPVLAVVQFGWMAVAGWIVVGCVFMGAVHDYLSLMMSVRNRGASVAEVAERTMGTRASLIFSAFLWAALVLIIAVFGISGARTLIAAPQMVIPSFSLILIAMLFGWVSRRFGVNLAVATLFAVGANFIAIYIGYLHPISLPASLSEQTALMVWFGILIAYGALASVLPVWLLLQPRDYICVYKLYIGLALGIGGIMVGGRTISAPAYTQFSAGGDALFPMLFVIVACGAISGFHSLVAGGTTSKQLNRERDGKRIGYGAMIVEGVLAIVALISVSAGLAWQGTALPGQPVLQDVVRDKGWMVAFGQGYGTLVASLPIITATAATLFGMIMLKTFILTTLDTATRLARFIIRESIGEYVPQVGGRVGATLVTVGPALWLGYSNKWQVIWPVFGAANQLIAALALLVISAYLVGIRKPAGYTLVPAMVMTCITVSALAYQAYGFFFGPSGVQWTLAIACVVLLVLAGVVIFEAAGAYRRLRVSAAEGAVA